jgi:hypothetical protein
MKKIAVVVSAIALVSVLASCASKGTMDQTTQATPAMSSSETTASAHHGHDYKGEMTK